MKKSNIIILVCVFVCVLSVVFIVWAVHKNNTTSAITGPAAGEVTEAETWGSTLKEDGTTYTRNRDLTTVLFLGVDKLNEDEDIALNNGRADTVMLLIMDRSGKTTKLLSVSRDTMIDIDVYDASGDYRYTVKDHINMQYWYGDSVSRSSYLTKKVVSDRLLHGIRIDGVISLTADGLNRLVKEMDGITVTFPNDYTVIDPRYEKGATVTLNGDEAERLFRYRDKTQLGSNESRVQRQLSLVESIFSTVKGKLDADSLEEMLETLGKDFYSDVDADTLNKLLTYDLEEETYTLPGQVVEGEQYDEFYVDEDAFRKLLIGLYYVPLEK